MVATPITNPKLFDASMFLSAELFAIHETTHFIKEKCHVEGTVGACEYLPLCTKPSFLALLENNEGLLEDYIRHSLNRSYGADLLIFIADGEVMETAMKAVGSARGSKMAKQTEEISKKVRAMVDKALAKIGSDRVRGVVHWSDVASSPGFQAVLSVLEDIMSTAEPEGPVESIQVSIKALVKNLMTQRVEKMQSKGLPVSNIYVGSGFEIKPKSRYQKRYSFLERSCLLELTGILTGPTGPFGENFTEMRYLTTDPRGMSFISECVQSIRLHAEGLPSAGALREAASKCHGITFAIPSLSN